MFSEDETSESNVERRPMYDLKGQHRCEEHGEDWEFFCDDHMALCCGPCVNIYHSRRQAVHNIYTELHRKDVRSLNIVDAIEKLQNFANSFIEELKKAKLGTALTEKLSSALRYIDDIQMFFIENLKN